MDNVLGELSAYRLWRLHVYDDNHRAYNVYRSLGFIASSRMACCENVSNARSATGHWSPCRSWKPNIETSFHPMPHPTNKHPHSGYSVRFEVRGSNTLRSSDRNSALLSWVDLCSRERFFDPSLVNQPIFLPLPLFHRKCVYPSRIPLQFCTQMVQLLTFGVYPLLALPA
jgi:hypothetical protein